MLSDIFENLSSVYWVIRWMNLIPSLTAYLLILTRITAFFVTVPLFSYRSIPATQRIIFGALLAWMLVYTIDVPDLDIDGAYLLLVMKEAMIGLFIGIIAFIVMSAIQIAGGFIDFQMGFAIANVIDPQTGAQSPLTRPILQFTCTLTIAGIEWTSYVARRYFL